VSTWPTERVWEGSRIRAREAESRVGVKVCFGCGKGVGRGEGTPLMRRMEEEVGRE